MPACFGRGEMTRSDADSMLLSLLICGLLKSFPCRCLRSKELICWRMRLMYFSTCSPGVAGMVNATITPAMVACTPLCMKRYHSSMPSQRYSQRRRMLQRLAMMSRSSTPPPASSHDRERWMNRIWLLQVCRQCRQQRQKQSEILSGSRELFFQRGSEHPAKKLCR